MEQSDLAHVWEWADDNQDRDDMALVYFELCASIGTLIETRDVLAKSLLARLAVPQTEERK